MAVPDGIRVGPAGWSYPDWKGQVYPKPQPRGFDPLSYLAAYFDAVEINAQLLKNLGFSYQKAAFVSDHLDAGKRHAWCTTMWPQILRLAKDRQALRLFGDEASFPQWGSLTYTWARRG